MQTHFLDKFRSHLFLAILFVTSQTTFAQRTADGTQSGEPPAITLQPANQTADHGANVSFTVEVNGTALNYQWQKNGKDLADYGNVSGAKTATLKLVGVAQIDGGDYAVVVSNGGGAVTSEAAILKVNPVVVFRDDFESGNLRRWTAFSELPGLQRALRQTAAEQKLTPVSRAALSPEAMRLVSSTRQNNTAGGSLSAMLDSSRQKMYHNLGVELAGAVRATFWIYDDNGTQYRCYGELRGYSGAGHGVYVSPSGMKQLFAIGRYTAGFGTNQTGTLTNEQVNPKKYQAKVERGQNRGWFNLDDAPDRTAGWHKFVIERDADGTTVRFYVDDVLGRTITGADHVLLDCVTIGSFGAGTGTGDAWFDDITVEAFPWRYDWQRKDSEGKGLFDWMKLRETGEDPWVTDIRQINTVAEVEGAGFSGTLGSWVAEGAAISATDMRGVVESLVTVPKSDTYRIEIEGRERTGKMPVVKLPLNIWLDGEFLGRFVLPYDEKTNGFVHCFTPFIVAGAHTIRVEWDNAENNCSLQLRALRLQSLAAVDLNANGFNDWAENRVLAQSGVDPVPNVSRVSPVCIEGRGQYLSLMRINRSTDGVTSRVAIEPGAGHRWYANVPLSANAPTSIEVLHQNGVLQETAEIRWEITNLLEAEDAVIRKGDSLLLGVMPSRRSSGVVSINIPGVANYTTDAMQPIAHRFDEPGTFTIIGTHLPTGSTRSINVKVVEASLGKSIAAWVGKRRFWDMENLPPEVVVDADPRLKLTRVSDEERAQQKPAPPSLGINGRQYSIITDAATPRQVVARLGENGPILASAAVEGFRLFNWYDTYLRYVQIHEDGSQTIEEAFILSPSLSNITVTVRIIVSGVTFDDGTVTKALTAKDFDELGICRVRYIRDDGVKTSVCHTTKVYQDGVLIGWPAYEK